LSRVWYFLWEEGPRTQSQPALYDASGSTSTRTMDWNGEGLEKRKLARVLEQDSCYIPLGCVFPDLFRFNPFVFFVGMFSPMIMPLQAYEELHNK